MTDREAKVKAAYLAMLVRVKTSLRPSRSSGCASSEMKGKRRRAPRRNPASARMPARIAR